MTTTSAKYGPWAVIAGASDGTGAAFARELAARGVNLVLVARRPQLLGELASQLAVETRVIPLDLTLPTAIDELAAATSELEIGLLVYNAGADAVNLPLLQRDLQELRGFVVRNCSCVLEASYHFGGRMVSRGRGGILLVTSGAAWAGGAGLAPYGATKAFDLVLAEALWAEWKEAGVDVLGLVLGATDTPSLRRSLERHGGSMGALADPDAVAVEALDHLADGPTWSYGMPDPGGPSPFATMSRKQAVELMSAGAAAMHADGA
ncbi:MAG TPA: SDR family NAD(P)-dependent oxidoreductase [Frankiaceae bacterium]|jgi:short-subunit dehydrogenase|nr:SDR family NAD(P)-dependent oxidoreductase [Frankiaceae bacterium]